MKTVPNIKKTIGILVSISVTQVLALAVLAIFALTGAESYRAATFLNQYLLVVVIVAASLAGSFLPLRFRGLLMRSDTRNHDLESVLADTEKLNQTLRAQRHDFLNHLQVVYGLIEMDEYRDAKDYIERVYNDIQKVSRVIKTSNTAVNALIQAKMMNAEKSGITVEFSTTTRLAGLSIPSWELCRVLGNLIDNALDSLREKNGERLLSIDMSEDLREFFFRITDNGPGIQSILMDRIFEPGFTTKGAKGEGMGLAIARDILREHGGDVKVSSSPSSTIFEVSVPKQA